MKLYWIHRCHCLSYYKRYCVFEHRYSLLCRRIRHLALDRERFWATFANNICASIRSRRFLVSLGSKANRDSVYPGGDIDLQEVLFHLRQDALEEKKYVRQYFITTKCKNKVGTDINLMKKITSTANNFSVMLYETANCSFENNKMSYQASSS